MRREACDAEWAQRTIRALAAEDEFEEFRDRPGLLTQAALNKAGNPEG